MKPILQYQLDAYKEAGIDEICIVVGYEGQAIINYCKHIKDFKIEIVKNADYENTNNMYSLYLAKNIVNNRPFILNNADLSIDSQIIKKLCESDEPDLIAVDTSLFNEESMKISIDETGIINDISKEINKDAAFGCSIDFYKFSQESCEIFFSKISDIIETEENRKDWTEVAMQRLFKYRELKFKPFDISGLKWVEIDNFFDLSVSDKIFSNYSSWSKDISAYYFDLDGTLYIGEKLIKGALDVIFKLKENGKSIYFLSNNSSKSKSDYVKRLNRFGIECNLEHIILSTDGVFDYMKKRKVKNLYVMGTKSLVKSFIDEGFEIDTHQPEYVIIGYDNELTYSKLATACRLVNNGVDYIMTHPDIFCPSDDGPIPDAGAIRSMIEITTSKKPDLIFGKPSSGMVLHHMHEHGYAAEKCVMIGDRLHTDIEMAKSAGMKSVLVLSGETSRAMVEDMNIKPDVILNTIADMC
jgi:HAD superfamily hydrolase (TIGR01450 family)